MKLSLKITFEIIKYFLIPFHTNFILKIKHYDK